MNYLNNYYRIKKYSNEDNLQNIWMSMININQNINEIFIKPNNYNKLVSYLGADPKIVSYENNLVKVSFNSNYSNDNIHFLLNFF